MRINFVFVYIIRKCEAAFERRIAVFLPGISFFFFFLLFFCFTADGKQVAFHINFKNFPFLTQVQPWKPGNHLFFR